MATAIVIEDNLKKVSLHDTIFKYDEERKDDLLSKTCHDLIVVFKDKDGEYPDGKIVQSDEFATLNEYTYNKDSDGNVTSCTVTRKNIKNEQSTDYEKTTTEIWYDKLGRVVKQEWYTRNGIMYKREQLWYYANGNVVRQRKIKSTHTTTTYEYRPDGQVSLVWNKTHQSKAINTKYKATFDIEGNVVHYIDGDKQIEVFVEKDKDHTNNILSETKIFKHLIGDRKIFAKTTTVYDPDSDYKISKVFKNGFLTEDYKYNLKGELIEVLLNQDDAEVMTRINRSVDEETGEKTVEKHIYITDKHGKVTTKYVKEVFDNNDNLLIYSEDNSKVTTYTYNEDGRRETAITKQLIDNEFVVVDKITYTYALDENEKGSKTRVEERYDKKGNLITKSKHTEVIEDTEKEYVVEHRLYQIPEE